MKCPNCGKDVHRDQARFCPHCGQRLDGVALTGGQPSPPAQGTVPMPADPPPQPAPGPAPQPAPPAGASLPPQTPPPAQGKRRSNHLGLVLIVAAVLILAAAALLFLRRKDDGEDMAAAPSSQPTMPATYESQSSALSLPTPTPSLPPIPTAAPTPEPTAAPSAAPTAAPTPSAQPTPLPVLPGLEVQPDVMPMEDLRPLLRVATDSSRLNMRAGPGTGYDVVGQADHDAVVVQVGSLSQDAAWIVIEAEGVYGWASAEYLAPIN